MTLLDAHGAERLQPVGNEVERFSRFHQLNTPYLDRLRAAGVRPEDIDIVLCTHLHNDHVGWNTTLVDGRWVPTFPNAKYLFSKTESEFGDPRRNPVAEADLQRRNAFVKMMMGSSGTIQLSWGFQVPATGDRVFREVNRLMLDTKNDWQFFRFRDLEEVHLERFDPEPGRMGKVIVERLIANAAIPPEVQPLLAL